MATADDPTNGATMLTTYGMTADEILSESLTKYEQYDHRTIARGSFHIGNVRYLFGMFVTAPRKVDTSTAAHRDGYRYAPAKTRIVMVRADANSQGAPYLPRVYRRNSRTMFAMAELGDRVQGPTIWYVSGYSNRDGVVWLDIANEGQITGQYEETAPPIAPITRLTFV